LFWAPPLDFGKALPKAFILIQRLIFSVFQFFSDSVFPRRNALKTAIALPPTPNQVDFADFRSIISLIVNQYTNEVASNEIWRNLDRDLTF
jgi:hypothetical protein